MEEYKVKVYQNNAGKRIEWRQNNRLHRLDGPAEMYCQSNGNKRYEYYFLYGKLHNENGPATITYYENGSIQSEYYYLNNVKLSKEDWLKKINKSSCDGKTVDIDGKKYKLTAV